MRSIFHLLLALVLFSPAVLEAAHTRATLLLGADAARPGETVLAGVLLKMEPKWHTYWKNPGASGMATTIEWQLPAGISAGEIQWPAPEKLPDDDLTTYIYKDEVVLLVPLKLQPAVPPGKVELKAKVSWLECEVMCLPGAEDVAATLTVSDQQQNSRNLELLETWQKKLPKKDPGFLIKARWEKPPGTGQPDSRPFILAWQAPGEISNPDFFPYASEAFEVQPQTEVVSASKEVQIRKAVKKLSGDWPAEIAGVLVQFSEGQRQAYEVKAALSDGVAGAPGRAGEASAGTIQKPLWRMLFYAFLGGMILNIMPCVLPVISLKILGFVSQARDNPKRVRQLGIVYTVGVLVSFLALAALIIGVKAAGHQAGWGMQFGNPLFLVALTILVTLVALSLFGLFEVNPGGKVLDAAGKLSSKEGASGAFFNGVLATILATPCTAPFLGVALGFAFAQPAPMVVLIFLVAGLGLAAPYLILSWEPAWLKFLPRPGAWMERFKVIMGFPMLATAVWLFSLTYIHYGPRAWWLAVFLVVVGLAAYIYGEFVQRARTRPGLAIAAATVLLLAGYAYILEGQLHWRSPLAESASGQAIKTEPGGIAWEPWSPAAVEQARNAGRPVLVDFTADWCLTCRANKKFAIDIPQVRTKLKEINAVALLGDYTKLPANITAELNRYGRAGVPLVLVYPKNPSEPPQVLPEALTPTIVLNALDRAAKL